MRVRVDSDRVLSMLLDKAQFDVARSYATIVGSTANEVTVKEVSRVQSDLLHSFENVKCISWLTKNSVDIIHSSWECTLSFLPRVGQQLCRNTLP